MRRLSLCCLALVVSAELAAQAPTQTPTQTQVRIAGKEIELALGGLLQIQAEAGDRGDARFTDDNDRVYLRRSRVNVTGRFKEDFDFRVEFDFTGTLASSSGLRGQLTDAYLTWTGVPAANVRAGQFKSPFGFEQLYSDPRLFTLERSLVNDRLTVGRQLGVQVAGEALEKRVSYAAGAFNGTGTNTTGNDDDSFLLAGRLGFVPWRRTGERKGSWAVGANVLASDDTNVAQASELRFDSTPGSPERDNIFAGERTGLGVDTQLNWGPFDFWAEYLRVEWEPDSGLPRAEVESAGWYALAGWFVLPDKLQLVLRLEDFDPRDADTGDSTRIATAGVNWLLKGHDLKAMLNYLRVESDTLPEDQGKVLARFQLMF